MSSKISKQPINQQMWNYTRAHPRDLYNDALRDLSLCTESGCALQERDSFPQISLWHLDQRINPLHTQDQASSITVTSPCTWSFLTRIPNTSDFHVDLFAVFEILLLTDFHQTLLLNLVGEGFEAEFGAAGRQRLDDSAKRNVQAVNTQKSQEEIKASVYWFIKFFRKVGCYETFTGEPYN